MDDFLDVVAVRNGGQNVLDDACRRGLAKVSLFGPHLFDHPIVQSPTTTEFHHQINFGLVLIDVVQSNDVGVLDVQQNVHLPADLGRVRQFGLVDRLEGADPPGALVATLADGSKTPLAQDVLHQNVFFGNVTWKVSVKNVVAVGCLLLGRVFGQPDGFGGEFAVTEFLNQRIPGTVFDAGTGRC